jgi:hypothetical protein
VEDFGEEEEATESSDEGEDAVNRYTEARGGGKRGRGVTLDSVDDEVSVLPPPSAQAHRPKNKRRKPTQTKAKKANSQLPVRLSSPVVDIFDIAQVDCELGVQVLVNGKSLFARSYTALDLILDDLIMRYQVEVEQGAFSGPLWDVKIPVYGPEFALHIGSKLVTRVNCNSQDDWVRFARRWWEVRERSSVAITVKIPYLANAIPPLSVPGVVGANLDSTQARRQGPPSATQRQRQANADRVPLDQASGGDIPRRLIDRWKCQIRNCKSHGYACWPGDDGHILMDTMFLKKWVDAIREGHATIENPPAQMLVRLLLNKEKAQTNKKISRGDASLISIAKRHGIVTVNFRVDAARLAGTPSTVQEPPSSPPFRPGNDDDNLVAYMDWLGRRFHIYHTQFNEFKARLQQEGWGFDDLKKISESQWKELGVGGGFVKKITSNMKVFTRERSELVDAPSDATEEEVLF